MTITRLLPLDVLLLLLLHFFLWPLRCPAASVVEIRDSGACPRVLAAFEFELGPAERTALLETLNKLTDDQAFILANRLEQRVDEILAGFFSGKITGEIAETMFLDKSLLEGTGYYYQDSAAETFVIAKPTTESFDEWSQSLAGAVISPSTKLIGKNQPDDGLFKKPGYIAFGRPNLDNGFGLFAKENEIILQHYLMVVAEEYYHVCQNLRSMRKKLPTQMLVSKYFREMADRVTASRDGLTPHEHALKEYFQLTSISRSTWPNGLVPSQQLRKLILEMSEADVYAKLLEVIGPEKVPLEYERAYELRKTVQRSAFK